MGLTQLIEQSYGAFTCLLNVELQVLVQDQGFLADVGTGKGQTSCAIGQGGLYELRLVTQL